MTSVASMASTQPGREVHAHAAELAARSSLRFAWQFHWQSAEARQGVLNTQPQGSGPPAHATPADERFRLRDSHGPCRIRGRRAGLCLPGHGIGGGFIGVRAVRSHGISGESLALDFLDDHRQRSHHRDSASSAPGIPRSSLPERIASMTTTGCRSTAWLMTRGTIRLFSSC